MEASQTNSKKPILFFLAVLILTIITVFLLVTKCASDAPTKRISSKESTPSPSSSTLIEDEIESIDVVPRGTPEELVGNISDITLQAHATGDITTLLQWLNSPHITPEQRNQLRKLNLALDPTQPFSKVPGKKNLWTLNLANNQKIHLSLTQSPQGKWEVARITLPKAITPPVSPATATVQKFLTSITQLNPSAALRYIDPDQVSYARLAGLCIIFEEGKYQLIPKNPLRKMFLRDTSAGWLARLKSPQTGESATFSINAKRKDKQSPWKITAIDLDQLLADYADRMAGGDIHYTPLIKNPKGGDALVIFFDLNDDQLVPRSQRQLSIVAQLLKSDTSKQLSISGYTDALGSDPYNLALSKKRASLSFSAPPKKLESCSTFTPKKLSISVSSTSLFSIYSKSSTLTVCEVF